MPDLLQCLQDCHQAGYILNMAKGRDISICVICARTNKRHFAFTISVFLQEAGQCSKYHLFPAIHHGYIWTKTSEDENHSIRISRHYHQHAKQCEYEEVGWAESLISLYNILNIVFSFSVLIIISSNERRVFSSGSQILKRIYKFILLSAFEEFSIFI